VAAAVWIAFSIPTEQCRTRSGNFGKIHGQQKTRRRKPAGWRNLCLKASRNKRCRMHGGGPGSGAQSESKFRR
jgi:hypothetical protein